MLDNTNKMKKTIMSIGGISKPQYDYVISISKCGRYDNMGVAEFANLVYYVYSNTVENDNSTMVHWLNYNGYISKKIGSLLFLNNRYDKILHDKGKKIYEKIQRRKTA